MEKDEKKPLLSLKRWVNKFPERFPVNYYQLDEETIHPAAMATPFMEKYAQCSAYRAKGYLVFMHHFPISKPEMNHE